MVDASCELEIYPRVPRPWTVDASCGVEMILERFVTADERYPREPRPCMVEKRVADEMKVEGTDDKYPRVPRPCTVD